VISFQEAVQWWCVTCHGVERTKNEKERTLRFIEEAIELSQSAGLSKEEVIRMVEWVYSRESGVLPQEVGGVMVTLAALCSAFFIHMDEEAETELRRIWNVMDVIRKKQQSKISAAIGS